MAMTNAERQRAWRIRRREAEGRKPRRRGERAAAIAREDGVSARTVYRSSHYARAIDTIAVAYPKLIQTFRQSRGPRSGLRIGDKIVSQRIMIMLADVLRDDPEGFAEHALPLFADRWTGKPIR